MLGFDIRDLFLSVANYFSSKEKNSIQLTFGESKRLFKNPFNMVTINSKGETDGVLIMHYVEQLVELKENGLPLRSNQEIQNTWICLSKEMLDVCLPKLDKQTGVLVYIRISNDEYKVIEVRKATKMHNNPYPAATLSELLNIQAKKYWWYKNHVRTVDDTMKQLGYKK